METIQEIPTDQIQLPENNMREYIDRDELFELAADIKANGLISPITVRPIGKKYELVAGQRRYLAHQYAGLIKIKCFVRELTDEEAFAIMTSENLSRVDVNPVDEARHVARLMEVKGGDIEAVKQIVRRGEKWIRDRLAIGKMPDYMQELLANKELKIGVALILSQITDENIRRMWTLQAVRDGANIAMAEYWLADFKRQLLPGGALAGTTDEQINLAPPSAVLFRCALDGQQYDTRMIKSVLIYEGNLQYFFEFAKAFQSPPAESESSPGGN